MDYFVYFLGSSVIVLSYLLMRTLKELRRTRAQFNGIIKFRQRQFDSMHDAINNKLRAAYELKLLHGEDGIPLDDDMEQGDGSWCHDSDMGAHS
jgi:hypothetical protein